MALLEAGLSSEPAALALLDAALNDPEPEMRSTALSALRTQGRLSASILSVALADPVASVRLRAVQLAVDPAIIDPAGQLGAALLACLADGEHLVVIGALVALGDRRVPDSLEPVVTVAGSSREPLVVEEAVATLGALGEPEGLAVILELLEGAKAPLKRRCVAALGAFEGPSVEVALDRLASDRDWQVRQAVAMLRREG